MSGKFVRASKYRHVFGQATKKEMCYENLKITKNAWDSNIIEANGDFLAVNWDASGGGAFAIVPVSEVGRAPDIVPLFRGHKAPVMDTAFNPFNKRQVVSAADDSKICVWDIPEDYSFHHYTDDNDEVKDITEPKMVLSGHTRKVGHVKFHPCAANVIASSSLDYTVKIWNLDTGKAEITLQHKDLVTSFAFNYNGSLLATTSRDKRLRVWDIRKGEIVSEGPSHTGAKPSRVVWLGNTDRVLTTGFDRLSDRQVGIWDVNAIDKGPINGFTVIDASSGVLIPHFDEACSILYLAGKGDGNIRYYEYDNDILHEISQYGSTDPQRGFAVAPKSACNVRECEVVKSYKTIRDSVIEPISFIVPRKSELFQDDIYPDCPSGTPACTAEEWFAGKEVTGPLLMSMEAVFEGEAPSELRASSPAVSISKVKESAPSSPQKKEAKKEEPKEIKKEEPKKEEPKKEEPKKEEPTKDSPKLDDTLTSSSKVDAMLKKVEDGSDDEVDDNDGWDVVQKKEAKEEKKEEKEEKEAKEAKPESKEIKPEPKETKPEPKETKPEPKELKPETKAEPKETKPESKPSLKPAKEETKPEPTKDEQPAPVTPETNTKANAPTLKATVEKLAQIAVQFEEQIHKLTAAQAEKDERIAALEKKIDQLLK
ncbi:hypothetical protein DICA4_D28854 [Diutina catenulata]